MNAVEAYITDYPKPRIQQLLHEIHQLFLQTIPQVEYSIKWGIPYYHYIKALCYVYPKGEQLYIGFDKGYLMTSDYSILKTEGRKRIKVVYINQVEDLYQDEFMTILQEALVLNEQ